MWFKERFAHAATHARCLYAHVHPRIHFLHSPCARHYTSNVQRRSLSNQDRYSKETVGQKTLKTTLPRLLLMAMWRFFFPGAIRSELPRGKRHNLCLLPPGCAETAHPEPPGKNLGSKPKSWSRVHGFKSNWKFMSWPVKPTLGLGIDPNS